MAMNYEKYEAWEIREETGMEAGKLMRVGDFFGQDFPASSWPSSFLPI